MNGIPYYNDRKRARSNKTATAGPSYTKDWDVWYVMGISNKAWRDAAWRDAIGAAEQIVHNNNNKLITQRKSNKTKKDGKSFEKVL